MGVTISKGTGVMIILAYPEEFVTMIPAWYKGILELVGMVNHGKIAAGHAACALIDKRSGEIHYADFGRYVTPFGLGRTRMKDTDPEVEFEIKAEFDQNGFLSNKDQVMNYIFNHPEKTHGGDDMYISFNHEIDFEKSFSFMKGLNMKGSVEYNPFGKEATNCSRFVYDAILSGLPTSEAIKKLKKGSFLTPSPLGNVFNGTDEKAYYVNPEGIQDCPKRGLFKIAKGLFKKYDPTQESLSTEEWKKNKTLHFLDGIGDQAYFEILQVEEDKIKVAKYDSKGHMGYAKYYIRPNTINFDEDFELIHDSNSAWITILQNGVKARFLAQNTDLTSV